MLCMNFFNLMFFWQNLWRLFKWLLFSRETYPVLAPISNGIMFTVWPWMSDTRYWYFWHLWLCDILMRVSPGTVSSKTLTSFFCLSSITISGLNVVTTKLGGRVPPAGVWQPGISTKHVNLTLSRQSEIYFRILSCLYVYLPSWG